MKSEIENPSGDAFEADLKAYLDGELPFRRRLQLRAHLARCPKCQEELKFMQTIERELETEETEPLGADLRAKILENAPLEPSETEFKRPKMPRHIKRRLLVSGVAALLVASVVVPRFSGSSPQLDSSGPPGLQNFLSGGNSQDQASPQSGQKKIGLGSETYNRDYDQVAGASAASSASPAVDEANAPSAAPLESSRRASDIIGEVKRSRKAASSPGSADGLSQVPDAIFDDRRSVTNWNFTTNQRAVHKDGNLTVEVADAEKSGADAEQIIKNVGGFVASNSLSTGANERRSATLDCRIPVEKFEVAVGKIAGLGKVRAKNINGEDITARVAAAAARKSTLSDELSIASAQLRQKEKSRKASDVQAVYYARQEVRNLRLQAAQAKSQLEVLRRFSDLSSLYLTVQEKTKAAPVAAKPSELGLTMRDAWKSFLVSARLPIQLLIWILAYSPLWVPVLIIWKKWGRSWLSAA